MNESELNAIVGVIPEPEKCMVKVSTPKELRELQRIIRIFNINEEQKKDYKRIPSILMFNKFVYSNN